MPPARALQRRAIPDALWDRTLAALPFVFAGLRKSMSLWPAAAISRARVGAAPSSSKTFA